MKPKKIIVVYNQINGGYAEKIKEWATEGKLGMNVEITFLFRSNTPRRVVCHIPYTNGRIPSAFEHLRQISYNPNAIEKQVRLLTSKEMEKNANNNSKFRRRENTTNEEVTNTTAV